MDRYNRIYRVIGVVLVALVLVAVACGEASDDPEDCTEGEFFDETRERCQTCPAVVEPQCRPGCGFEIVDDRQGCPSARCLTADECDRCGEDAFFSSETLQCEACAGPSQCPDDAEPERRVSDGTCVLQCPAS